MYVTPEQIAAANKTGMEAILSLARTSSLHLSAWQPERERGEVRVRRLARQRARPGRCQGRAGVRELAELVRPTGVQKAISWSKSVYEVTTQANAELTRTAEVRASEWNQNLVSMLDKAAKDAPAGSDVAVSAVKQMIAAANSAYDSFSKATKQATEIAEANVSAATESSEGPVKSSKKVA